MRAREKRGRLQSALTGREVAKVAGVHDGLSARLASAHGFDALWASGFGISATQAVPDASILTMRDFLEAARAIDLASELPVIADCDSGFGNIHTIARMVQLYESAGISAVCIEDKVFPKLNSFVSGEHHCVSPDEFCRRIGVVQHARSDRSFLIIARCEALIAGLGIEAAIARCEAYARSGADAILIHSRRNDISEIAQFMARWSVPVPVVVVPTKFPHVTTEDLGRINVRMVIYANQAVRAAIMAMDCVFDEISRKNSSRDSEGRMASVDRVLEITGVPEMQRLEQQFPAGAGVGRSHSRPTGPLNVALFGNDATSQGKDAWEAVLGPNGLSDFHLDEASRTQLRWLISSLVEDGGAVQAGLAG